MATPGRAPLPNAAAATVPPAPALLLAMLQVSSHVSDLIFSPGSHPHVEVSGQLVPVKIPGPVGIEHGRHATHRAGTDWGQQASPRDAADPGLV